LLALIAFALISLLLWYGRKEEEMIEVDAEESLGF
jgi:disulfide bond formation protein DsbB